ncbi:MAG: hypothetical protein WDZ63_15825 [Burkholderiales bacterium]
MFGLHPGTILHGGRASRRHLRTVVVFVALAALYFTGNWLGTHIDASSILQEGNGFGCLVAAVLAAYVIVMALPFVPGIEIGMALMLLFGGECILVVYLCTQLALGLSYALGRLVPERTITALFRALRMERALRLVQGQQHSAASHRLASLADANTPRWLRLLLRHRHLALAVTLNMPGNAIIGGAGGIGMLAGMSGTLGFVRYALVVAAATTPVPLFLLLSGTG